MSSNNYTHAPLDYLFTFYNIYNTSLYVVKEELFRRGDFIDPRMTRYIPDPTREARAVTRAIVSSRVGVHRWESISFHILISAYN